MPGIPIAARVDRQGSASRMGFSASSAPAPQSALLRIPRTALACGNLEPFFSFSPHMIRLLRHEHVVLGRAYEDDHNENHVERREDVDVLDVLHDQRTSDDVLVLTKTN